MKSGSFSVMALPKSSKIAVTPPTCNWAPGLRSIGGITSLRMRVEQVGRVLRSAARSSGRRWNTPVSLAGLRVSEVTAATPCSLFELAAEVGQSGVVALAR